MSEKSGLYGRIAVSPVVKMLSNEDTYPYSVLGNALNIMNNGDGELTITLDHNTGDDTVLKIPYGFNWSDFVIPFYSINATGSSSFRIDIKRAAN